MKIKQKGWFRVQCFNRDGSLAWEEKFPNGATSAGLNDMLNVYFNSGGQTATWFIGLINNAGFSALSADDTMASHLGWSEFTDYSETVRQTWTPASVGGGSITNSTTSDFTNVSNGNTVYGLFLTTNSTKGGTTGIMWATGAFSVPRTLDSGQILKCSYTTTLQ